MSYTVGPQAYQEILPGSMGVNGTGFPGLRELYSFNGSIAGGGGLVEYPRRVRMRMRFAVRAAVGIRDRARRWKRFIQKTRDGEKERKGKGAQRRRRRNDMQMRGGEVIWWRAWRLESRTTSTVGIQCQQ